MRKNNIEPKKVQCIKNGKPGLKILKPLYSHLKNGEYTDDIKEFFQ